MSICSHGVPRTFSEVICQHLSRELRDSDEISNNRGPELHATDEPTPTVTRDPQAARGHGKEAHRNWSNELGIENNGQSYKKYFVQMSTLLGILFVLITIVLVN
jgi:hypothetical protein